MNTFSIWKFRAGIVAAMLAVTSLSPASHAQDLTTRLRVDVPFAFQYGSHHYAAGRYTIRLMSDHFVALSGGSASGMAMVNYEYAKPSAKGKVVFHRYGNNRYFLEQIWSPYQETHLACVKTSVERRVQKEMAFASSDGVPTQIEIALLREAR